MYRIFRHRCRFSFLFDFFKEHIGSCRQAERECSRVARSRPLEINQVNSLGHAFRAMGTPFGPAHSGAREKTKRLCACSDTPHGWDHRSRTVFTCSPSSSSGAGGATQVDRSRHGLLQSCLNHSCACLSDSRHTTMREKDCFGTGLPWSMATAHGLRCSGEHTSVHEIGQVGSRGKRWREWCRVWKWKTRLRPGIGPRPRAGRVVGIKCQ